MASASAPPPPAAGSGAEDNNNNNNTDGDNADGDNTRAGGRGEGKHLGSSLEEGARVIIDAVSQALEHNERLIADIQNGQKSCNPASLATNERMLRQLSGNLATVKKDYATLAQHFEETLLQEKELRQKQKPPTAA